MTDQMTLPEPFTVPESPRVMCNVGPGPWADGDNLEPATQPDFAVPRALADHVHRVKQAAAEQVAQEFQFGKLLTQLDNVTRPHHTTLARLESEYRQAADAGATPAQLQGIAGFQLAPRKQAQQQLHEAVQNLIAPVREQLSAAERAAMQELEDRPGIQPSADEYAAAIELARTLDLMPPVFAAKVLMQRLVIEPSRSGKVGLTTAAIPLLKAQLRNPAYEASREYADLLRCAQVVTRDQAYHAAHRRLRAAGTLRYKLDRLAEDVVAPHGIATAAMNPIYTEFGAIPPAES